MKNRKSDLGHIGRAILLSCALVFPASAVVRGGDTPGQTPKSDQAATAAPPSEMAVPLKEIPLWEVANERVRQSFLRGQFGAMAAWHKGQVQRAKYPEFASDAPFWGIVRFLGPAPGSPESPVRHFALDGSRKDGDYDLLYFDENTDGDLTNDRPRKPAPELDRLARRLASTTETFFEPVTVTFNVGPGVPQAVELIPYMKLFWGKTPQLTFIAARVHTGTFELDGTSYQAFVGYQNTISGRLDQPFTALHLLTQGGEPIAWSGGDRLNATHLLGGRYYRFSCTPTGDKLTVQPYTGPLGVFEIGPGSRKVGTLTMVGSLCSATTSVPVAAAAWGTRPAEPARCCKLPVGDYRIDNLRIQADGLQVFILSNYHLDGKPMGALGRQDTYGIAIREDKPLQLAFSESGQILFAAPARGQRVRLGEELTVKAVLIDPALNVMFRDVTCGRQLNPNVTIARANDAIVAVGWMPFG
jgi:hypothetical protein